MSATDATGHPVLTIGHSSHSLQSFTARLSRHRVNAVADVRSAPYSRFKPHFNRNSLAAALEELGIKYVYLGHELGGRSDDPACYEGGRIRYDRVTATHRFRCGLDRVIRGAATHRIALMCAEKEPLDCHRTLLVARALDERGVGVAHILPAGDLEWHADTMDRLLAKRGLSTDGDLFRPPPSREELVAEAIARQARDVAFIGDGSDAGRKRQDR